MPGATASLTSLEDAVARLLADAPPACAVESVPLRDAPDRVLAADIVAPLDVPSWDCSAMDGFAFARASLERADVTLPVVQRIAAGTTGAPLAPGCAARIFTGGLVPPGADTIVPQEDCAVSAGRLIVRRVPPLGANIRFAGEDVRQGTTVLAAGVVLGSAAVGVAASLGLEELPVYRRRTVAMFCTGDELVKPGRPLGRGQIYGSNSYTLGALLARCGCEILDLGYVPDCPETTADVLDEAARRGDVVISTGGVSVGEEDHVRRAVERVGCLDLWRLNIKPGKPLVYGRVRDTPFIGLPGNPAAVFVTFLLVVRPFLRRLQGATVGAPAGFPVRAAFEWPRPNPRREFLRARVMPSADGTSDAVIHPRQGSGALSATVWADGLIDIPAAHPVQRGDLVRFLPLAGLLG
jgi:molybdopterin molybdotransferase